MINWVTAVKGIGGVGLTLAALFLLWKAHSTLVEVRELRASTKALERANAAVIDYMSRINKENASLRGIIDDINKVSKDNQPGSPLLSSTLERLRDFDNTFPPP